MSKDIEAEQWKAKARLAEEKAAKAAHAGDLRNAAIWRESALIYWELATRREAWANAWKPRARNLGSEEDEEGEAR
jgi:hypothetical protein